MDEIQVDLEDEDRRLLTEYPRSTVALGLYHTVAISRHGKVYAWGGNTNGQLGIGSIDKKKKKTTQQLRQELRKYAQHRDMEMRGNKFSKEYSEDRVQEMTYKEVLEGLNKVTQDQFNDDKLYDKPPKEDQHLPVLVPFPREYSETFKIVEVACGIKHTIALDSMCQVYSWGSGANGKLGHGDKFNEDKHVPTLIEVISRKKTIRIACGTDSSCCLMDSGQIYSFGVGRYGNLGHGTNIAQNVPMVIDALVGHKMIYVSMGSKHTVAIEAASTSTQDNPDPTAPRSTTVWAWGSGAYGRLGAPSDDGEFRPVEVTALRGENIVLVSAAETHTIAINNRGEVFTWGAGDYGKLGHGDTSNCLHPKRVEELRHVHIKSIKAASFHSLALTNQGLVYAWGGGSYGKLGHGDTMNQIIPRVVDRLENVVSVVAGTFHSGFVTTVGNLYVAGYGGNGRLGINMTTSVNVPTQVHTLKNDIKVQSTKVEVLTNKGGTSLSDVAQSKAVKAVFLGGFHSFAVTETGLAFAFGDGRFGQLGINMEHLHKDEKKEKLEPKYVPGLSSVAFMACGAYHTIAITSDGKLFTWGRGLHSVLGHGDTTDQPEPRMIRTMAHKKVKHCAANELHSVCCTEEGELFTWGSSDFGKLGHGELNDESTPRLVQSMSKKVIQVGCGFSHTICLVDQTFDVYGWGSGHNGMLGTGDDLNRSEPTIIEHLKRRNVVMIACGGFFSLAVTRKGTIISWGCNDHGQLGRVVDAKNEPGVIESLRQSRVKQVACGEAHALALIDDGSVLSWGSNVYGQLGHGTKQDESEPRLVELMHNRQVSFVAAGSNHSMVVTLEGDLFVWGNGANGRLGINSVGICVQPTQCTAIAASLKETGTVGRQMLSELQGTTLTLDKMINYLTKSKAISQRVQEKLVAKEPVDMQDELDGMDLGEDSNMRENLVLTRAAAIATGVEPATLSSLQQLVKSEAGKMQLDLKIEQDKIAQMRKDLDQIVRENDRIEMETIEIHFKIGNVIRNQLQLQQRLASGQGYVAQDLIVLNRINETKLQMPLEQYAKMLAILYESPQVLMYLAESLPADDLPSRERFWKIVNLTIFGDQNQARDEFQLLSLAHQMFIERGGKVSTPEKLLDSKNESLGILIHQYLQRNTCRRAIRLTLMPVVNEVLERGKSVELHPVELYKQLYPKGEVPDAKNAREDLGVKDLYTENVRVVEYQCKQFLQRITATHSLIPYGVRWMAKRLDEIADERLQTRDKANQRVVLVCKFIFNHLFNPGIVTPKLVGITKDDPTETTQQNLKLIELILDHVITGTLFRESDPNEQHLATFNSLIVTSKDALEAYVEMVTSVKHLDSHNRESRYIQTLSSLTPVIPISVNDVAFLHRLVDQGYRAFTIPGERTEWLKILAQAGMVRREVDPKLDHKINVQIRLSNRVIWPDQEQPPESIQEEQIKSKLLMALQSLNLLGLSASGTLPENLEKVKQAATEAKTFEAADQIQEVLGYIKNKQTANPLENKHFNDQFLRDTAAQVKKLARTRNMLRQEVETLKAMKDSLKYHGTQLKQRQDRSNQYLKNVKQKKLTVKNVQMVKRKKYRDEFERPQVRKRVDASENQLLVKSVLKEEHNKLLDANPELKTFIEQRLEVLRKIELAEEVDLNADWQQLFEDYPKLMELIGRTPSLESLIKQDQELVTLMKENEKFATMLYDKRDLTQSQLQDFLQTNAELREFVSEHDSLKQLLETRAKLYEKNKSMIDSALDETDFGPMYTMTFSKAQKEGIVVSMHFPNKILRRTSLQFSSSIRGNIDILAFEHRQKRAIGHFKVTKEKLIDLLGADKKFIEINKAKFNVEKLLVFVDAHLRW